MAFEELKQNFSEADASIKSYLESTREFYKLKGFKVLMKGVMVFAKVFAIGFVLLLSLLFLSLAAAFWIGQEMDSNAKGFLVVGLVYTGLGILIYIFRHKLRRPLLQKFSEFYFDEV